MSTLIAPRHPLGTMLDTMAATGRFATMIAALGTAGLSRSLRLQGPFTLFAPSDWAFAKLPKRVLDDLLREPHQIEHLLRGHLVAGRYFERDLIPFTRLPSLAGRSLNLSLGDGDVFVNGVTIVTTDIEAGNGVVHEMDRVLMLD
ncbi:MAG: fasciclin domain-containing protein [Gemmatimonadales bacterium]